MELLSGISTHNSLVIIPDKNSNIARFFNGIKTSDLRSQNVVINLIFLFFKYVLVSKHKVGYREKNSGIPLCMQRHKKI